MVNGLISWTSSDFAVTSLLINNITDERAGIQGFDSHYVGAMKCRIAHQKVGSTGQGRNSEH